MFSFDFARESDWVTVYRQAKAGVVDNKETPDNDSNKTRSFWIQGRSGPHWQNLENFVEAQGAILRLGELVSQDRYDELKLLEAHFYPITGQTDYLHIVTIRDRQVIEQPETGAPVQQELSSQIVIPEDQMVLWGEPDASKKEQQADFWQIDKAATDTEQTVSEPDTANTKEPYLHRANTGGEIESERTESKPQKTASESIRQNAAGLISGLADWRSQRKTDRKVPERRSRAPGKQDRTVNRGVLLSGALAGAFAVGLVIAAMDPKSASSIAAAMFQQGVPSDPAMTIDLASAVVSDNPQSVRQALIAGADPNQLDGNGIPVLLQAARHGLPLTVDLLLQAGADPAAPISDGRSVLHLAASEGLSEPLRLMLRSGAEPDLAGGPYGCLTPLGLAAANGRVRAAAILADFDASLDPLPGCDVSPIELAAAYPVVRSRLEAIAAARRSAVADAGDIVETPTTTVALPISLDVPEPKETGKAPIPVAVTLPIIEESAESEPEAPVVASTIEAEQITLPEPINLASIAPQSSLEVAALTSASSTYETPRAPVRPKTHTATGISGEDSAITADIRLDTELARLIAEQSLSDLQAALAANAGKVDLASLEIPVFENGSTSYRNPVDYAILTGKLGQAQALIDAGGKPGADLLHEVVDGQNDGNHHPALHFLLKNDANTNSFVNGLTPLMRAARNGDNRTTTLLLAYGADPGVISDTGMKAADIAASSGAIDIQEKLAIAEAGDDYESLMFGLSWYDTLEKIKPKAETCKSVSDGFVACKLSVPSWLDGTSAVIAQFDTYNGDRLVALQIDSMLYSNELEARKGFDDAVTRIDTMLPAGQPGYTVHELAKGMPYFEGLKPSVNTSNYYHYWPDEDRAKPVYLHLKMIGHTTRQGFYRLIIGNPFRIG